jgi:hypothetical protein
MYYEIAKIIIPVMLAFTGFIWKLFSAHNEKVIKAIEGIKADMHAMQLDMAKHYITRSEYDKEVVGNSASHATMWGEVNLIKERIKAVEVVQEHCPGCNK